MKKSKVTGIFLLSLMAATFFLIISPKASAELKYSVTRPLDLKTPGNLLVNGKENSYILGNLGIGVKAPTIVGEHPSPKTLQIVPETPYGAAYLQLGGGSPINGNGVVRVGYAGYLSGNNSEWNTALGMNIVAANDETENYWYTPTTTTGYGFRGIHMNYNEDLMLFNNHIDTVAGARVNPRDYARMTIRSDGNVGIGTRYPRSKLEVNGGIQGVAFVDDDPSFYADLNVGGRLGGTWEIGVLKITGGGDITEPFDIKGPEDILPGMVVSIDPSEPGKLRLAGQAYDRKVAGIVSGANGINPGISMGQQGTVADGEYPVALTGRVYAWADTTNGAIEPGDLLTSSNTPGHAMKVKNYSKAQGAIIGKAMTSLDEGKGLVLVLVTLQ